MVHSLVRYSQHRASLRSVTRAQTVNGFYHATKYPALGDANWNTWFSYFSPVEFLATHAITLFWQKIS
jgi:hypothetical protein